MMQSREVPPSYTTIVKLVLLSGEEFTEALRQIFEFGGEAFEPATARFEVDVYSAFRVSDTLQRNPRAWEDLCLLTMNGIVGVHRNRVKSLDLSAVFEERVEAYNNCWNEAFDSKKYPAQPCLQMLRTYIHGAAKSGRIDAHSPLEASGDLLAEFSSMPTLIELESACFGKLGCIMKHIMRASDDIGGMTEEQVLQAAIRGKKEADQILQQAGLPAPQGKGKAPQRKREWWKFWR